MPHSIVDDNLLIDTGNYFWCSGHLGAIPVTEQSANKKYCNFCLSVISETDTVGKQAATKVRTPILAVKSPPPTVLTLAMPNSTPSVKKRDVKRK